MSVPSRHNSVRRGVTLVELLVVVGIIVLLASIAIPAIRPAMEGSRIRETARSVNVYVGRARILAMETGRPHGVMFERLQQQPDACRVLKQVEVPPPYAGDLQSSLIQLTPYSGALDPGGQVWWDVEFDTSDSTTPTTWAQLVNEGDLLQLNYQGDIYQIHFPDLPGSGKLAVMLTNERVARPPLPNSVLAAGLPFQVFRQPVPSAVRQCDLPGGAVIDLAASGFDSALPDSGTEDVAHTFAPADDGDFQPVIVMFSPNGSIDRVFYSRRMYDVDGNFVACAYAGRRVTEPVHLLVGKWERVALTARAVNVASPGAPTASQAEDGLYNWEDARNLWVAVGPQTGLVTVAQLCAEQLDATTNTYVPKGSNRWEKLVNSREFARQKQVSKGGR